MPDHNALKIHLLYKGQNPGTLFELLKDEHEVMATTSAEELAQHYVADHGHLIVVDLSHHDDMEMLEHICASITATPVVACGLSDIEQGRKALQAGAQDYLQTDELTQACVRHMVRHATERFSLVEQMKRLAMHDALTGLANRPLFEEMLKKQSAIAAREGIKMAIMHINLDDFGHLNREFGRLAGDQVLEQVGTTLSYLTRASDTAARVDGDAFAVLLYRVNSPAEVAEIAERTLEVLNKSYPFVSDDKRHATTLSASIGAALFPDHDKDVLKVMALAEAATAQAKRQGKQCYVIHQDAVQPSGASPHAEVDF